MPLLNPDVLVCSVGTEIFYESASNGNSQPQVDSQWAAHLDRAWNREAAVQAAASIPELQPQVQHWIWQKQHALLSLGVPATVISSRDSMPT